MNQIDDFSRAKSQLTKFLQELRSQTPRDSINRISGAGLDRSRVGYLNGMTLPRAVITLRSVGCSWTHKGGGCTMCGHLAGASSESCADTAALNLQFDVAFEQVDWSKTPILSLYNGGSVLNKDEVPDEALTHMMARAAAEPGIKAIALESRPEFVSAGKLMTIKDIIGNRELTIAMGLESARADVLALSVHKGVIESVFYQACETIKKYAKLRIYVLIKPPWLTESEMIDDAVAAIRRAHELGADEIHFEPLTIQNHTLLGLLWRAGKYRLPWLWSIVEVLQRVSPKPVYVSPFAHLPAPVALPHNCDICSDRFRKTIIEDYNQTFDIGALNELSCSCETDWRTDLAKTDSRPIHVRILDDLPTLYEELGKGSFIR